MKAKFIVKNNQYQGMRNEKLQLFFHSWIVSKPKVTLTLTENKKTNKNCQTSCIQGEQRSIDFIFRGDKKKGKVPA